MRTALLITTYNRPQILKKCLDSVKSIPNQEDFTVLIVDDASTDSAVERILSESGYNFICYSINKGIKKMLISHFDTILKGGFDLAINLDGDAIVRPNFITELKRLKSIYPKHIVSGFNCDNPKNPVLIDNVDHVMRRHCNGINMCINKEQYENIVRPALLKSGNWDYNSTNKLPFVIAKPSLVEHLGWDNSTMNHQNGDRACDF